MKKLQVILIGNNLEHIELCRGKRKRSNQEKYETDVEIIIPRTLVIYNEDTNKEKEKKLSPKKEIIKGYYTIKTDYKEETKIELVKSDMKDKDNQIIYYKHYASKRFI